MEWFRTAAGKTFINVGFFSWAWRSRSYFSYLCARGTEREKETHVGRKEEDLETSLDLSFLSRAHNKKKNEKEITGARERETKISPLMTDASPRNGHSSNQASVINCKPIHGSMIDGTCKEEESHQSSVWIRGRKGGCGTTVSMSCGCCPADLSFSFFSRTLTGKFIPFFIIVPVKFLWRRKLWV